MAKDVAKQVKKVHNITRIVDVDDVQSELNVKVDFNAKNGNFKVSTAITTKQYSAMNPEVNSAVLSQVGEMLRKGLELAARERTEWNESPDTNQISLDFAG